MKKYAFIIYYLIGTTLCWAQGNSYSLQLPFLQKTGNGYSLQYNSIPNNFSKEKKDKGKSVKYDAFGFGVFPTEHLMCGANHVSYRKFGFGISWRVGIQNLLINREGFSEIIFDTAKNNGWLTGNTKTSYSFGANMNFVFAITKKIPGYVGIGAVRQRVFSELQTPFANPGETEWQIDPHNTKFVMNFGTGVFIPIANRVILNLAYDHKPQTFFVGIAISGPYNYEDIDMW